MCGATPHNQRLHQEIHFVLLGADFWKSLWSGENQRRSVRQACAIVMSEGIIRANQRTVEKQASACGAHLAFPLLPRAKASQFTDCTNVLFFTVISHFVQSQYLIWIWCQQHLWSKLGQEKQKTVFRDRLCRDILERLSRSQAQMGRGSPPCKTSDCILLLGLRNTL